MAAQLIEFVGNHPFLFIALFAVLGMLFWYTVGIPTSGVKGVQSFEATTLINREDAVVVDVRDEGEFTSGHIINALHIPLKHLSERVDRLEKYRDKPLIVVCMSGNRSTQAAQILKNKGFEKLYNLKGGIIAWQNENLPLSKGREGKEVKEKNKNSRQLEQKV